MSRPGEIISCPEVVTSPLGIDGVQLYPPVEEGPTASDVAAKASTLTVGTK